MSIINFMDKVFFKETLHLFKKIKIKLDNDKISESAGYCAYFTILSFIPFIIFFTTLIQFTNIDKEEIFVWIKQLVPINMNEFVLTVIDEIYIKSTTTTSLSVIFALWSASKGFYYLCKKIRAIYKLEDEKIDILIRIEVILYTIALILSIILFLFIIVFGNKLYEVFKVNIKSLSNILGYFLKMRGIMLIFFMTILFLLIYQFIPKNKTKIFNQIPGAIFSSLLWYIISIIFSVIVSIFDFSNTYGSLTSIILVMIWTYICMYIILIGAEINVSINESKRDYFRIIITKRQKKM